MGKLQASRSKTSTPRRPADARAAAAPRPAAPAAAPAPSLQRARRLGHRVVQPKLTLGPADDQYERQADAVARQVVGTLSAPTGGEVAQRDGEPQELEEVADVAMAQRVQRDAGPGLEEMDDEEEPVFGKRLQRSALAGGGPLSAEVESGIESARSGGRPLDDAVRTKMEPAFGADFGGVRVHTGGRADGLNRSLQARAFTTGSDIFFRSGEYAPGSSSGQELLAHELTHVVQQGAAKSSG